MRKFLTVLLTSALCTCMYAQSSQRPLSLQQAIDIARTGSYDAERTEAEYRKGQLEFSSFNSTFKPHLDLNLNPNYIKEAYDHRYQYAYPRNYNMLSTVAELRLNQKVEMFGGDVYVSSSGIWTEHFNNLYDYSRLFGVTPVKIGYQQQVLGFNQYKWDRRIEESRLKETESRYGYELWKIARETAALYMEAFKAESMYRMYKENSAITERLYSIGKERFAITSVRNDELSSLELQWRNSVNSCAIAEVGMKNAMDALCSYLNLPSGDQLLLCNPEMLPDMILDREAIYGYVESNNPVYRQTDLDRLEAMRKEDRARSDIGVQASVDLNVGVQNYATMFSTAFGNQGLFSVSGVSLKVPIIDQRTAKDRYKAAQLETVSVNAQAKEDQRSLRVEVDCAIRDFEHYQTLLRSAAEATGLADVAYQQANENYANGIVDINTFFIAQTRKENAYTNYLNVLCLYWDSFYHLSMLCGTDVSVR